MLFISGTGGDKAIIPRDKFYNFLNYSKNGSQLISPEPKRDHVRATELLLDF